MKQISVNKYFITRFEKISSSCSCFSSSTSPAMRSLDDFDVLTVKTISPPMRMRRLSTRSACGCAPFHCQYPCVRHCCSHSLSPATRYYSSTQAATTSSGLTTPLYRVYGIMCSFFSNLSLFVLLPFAYLFTESEGFAGYRKCLMSRIFETSLVLFLLGIAMLGLTYIISNLLDKDKSSIQSLLNLWSYYLPFLYSCISFLGVVTLLLCTPFGFARLFGVVSSFLAKPQFLRNLNEEFFVATMEEECLKRRLEQAKASGKSYLSPPPMYEPKPVRLKHTSGLRSSDAFDDDDECLMVLRNGELQAGLGERLTEVSRRRELLDKQRGASSLRRNVVYPIAMLALLALTVLTVLMVVQNTLELLVGIKALPLSTRQFTLGISSLSKLGPVGASLEVVLILYLAVTSCVGLYTLPLLGRVRPRTHCTPFVHILVNCVFLLILSSALPVLARTIGITNFDLLGDFGRIEWLGNFKIVLLYNLVFAVSATLCLVNKFTGTVRKELYARLQSLFSVFIMRKDTQRTVLVRNTPTHSGKED